MPKKTKKDSPHHQWHSANTKYGMGDYYGTGVKQKVGRLRSSSLDANALSKPKLGKPPKSLA